MPRTLGADHEGSIKQYLRYELAKIISSALNTTFSIDLKTDIASCKGKLEQLKNDISDTLPNYANLFSAKIKDLSCEGFMQQAIEHKDKFKEIEQKDNKIKSIVDTTKLKYKNIHH